uniref:Uncharacterized protein n=1 Tax=viral metagenome TaxID=1070528 RepID=A0A6M3JI38_9ZZZZ
MEWIVFIGLLLMAWLSYIIPFELLCTLAKGTIICGLGGVLIVMYYKAFKGDSKSVVKGK